MIPCIYCISYCVCCNIICNLCALSVYITSLIFVHRPTPVTVRPSDLCMSKRRNKTTSDESVRKSQRLLEKQVKKLALSEGINQNPHYQIESEEIESSVYSAQVREDSSVHSRDCTTVNLDIIPIIVTLILVTRQAWQTNLVAQRLSS